MPGSPLLSSFTTGRGAIKPQLLVAIAVSLMLASAAILLSRGSTGPNTAGPEIDEADIPDITGPIGDVPDFREGGGIGPARNAIVKLKDRADPGRIAWEIEFAALDPSSEEDIVDIDRPRAWYFVGDNQAVYIRADSAEFVMPDISSEPESGRFFGNVELLQIDRNHDGTLPEPLPELSAVRITTAWLDFDAVAGELTTSEMVSIVSERVDAQCEGVRLVLNEVDSRLEYFEVPGTLVATITPPPAAPSDDAGETPPAAGESASRSAAVTPQPSGATASVPTEPASQQFYAAFFQGAVALNQPNRRLNADRALAWIGLTDNRFDADALAGLDPVLDPAASPRMVLSLEAALASMTIASISQPEGLSTDDLGFDAPIRFTCAGPTVIRPVDARPAELEGSETLAVRLEADTGNRVTFIDDALPADGDAEAIEYAFASKLLTLIGTANEPSRTTLADTGTLVAQTVSIGLATGVGQASGAGVLSDARGVRSVAWLDQADVVFRVENGWMTGSLEQAIASGSVQLRDEATMITAQDINARFAKADASAVIERAVLTGAVSATTSRGTLRARRADVRFLVEGDESTPHLAIATGEVRGEQEGQRIAADQIEADLSPADESDSGGGDLRVTAARATGSVRYDRENGTFATGDSVTVDADARTVLVVGAPGSVGTGEAVVEGERIALDESTSAIDVPGRGRLTIRETRSNTTEAEAMSRTLVAASWTDAMSFSDESGLLDARGDVQIVATPDPLRRDTVRGGRIVAVLEPADADEVNRSGGELGDRRLVSAVADGEGPDAPASAELLRYADGADLEADEPQRVMLLLGERIEANNAAGLLDVPAAGRLLIADRRIDPAGTNEESFRGSALFDWDGSMSLDRAAGRATMQRRVRLVHRPASADRGTVELECERLVSIIDPAESARLTDSASDAEVRSIDATGAVWARSGQQQILADTVAYDPKTGSANATASPGGWVTLFDPAQIAPVTASQLLWDVNSGRVEVIRPSPVSVPR